MGKNRALLVDKVEAVSSEVIAGRMEKSNSF